MSRKGQRDKMKSKMGKLTKPKTQNMTAFDDQKEI